ncbi:hypothetical protein [Marinobacterium rhizophilum]|uniref:Uncharacterized protein n=1 Tax=Marinobacterium rhizophilum TaxID=420402 RepID=A0ABY5HKN2_9GAMM|nr:hypothetical protein [Marinobacterium rhizophilum]UTW12957.1 hypothetical protein KDW95_04585 [Marinobacterium rhizophilum]
MTGMNIQNQHIKEKLVRATRAVNVLETNGLTVTAISIDGPWPLIEIIEGRACQKLQHAVSKWINKNGRRQCERVALVSDCQVRWIERN